MRNLCFGLVLALGLPAVQVGAATLQIFGGPVGGGCNNFICYSGAPTSGTLLIRNGPDTGNPFMSYNASVTGRGLFADFRLFGFPVNRGNMTLSSTNVFTVNSTSPGGEPTVDITVRMRTSGQFGASDLGPNGQVVTPSARSILGVSRNNPAVTILDETRRDVTVRPDLNAETIVVTPGVLFTSELDLRVAVGGSFDLSRVLSLSLGISGNSDKATGGAAFGNSALISFDLPEGYFVTSERGYSQGVPVVPVDPADPSVIPLPAGGLMLLSALGLLGWASRRRQRSFTA